MNCDRVQELLAASPDSGLPAEDVLAVEDHLRACADCASLAVLLRQADEALAAFPLVAPPRELLDRLAVIPERRSRIRTFLAALQRPALQPIMAAATVILTVISLYLLNPDRAQINKALARTFHQGVGQVEKLYAGAGSLTDTIGSYAENVFVSLKSLNPLGKDKD
jgi:predicted anti-sigma-YlaC factor YlaD